MNIIVADSCALILLAKSGLLKTLTAFRKVIIPAAVFEEVVNQGTIEKFPDAKSISVMTSQGHIEIFSKDHI